MANRFLISVAAAALIAGTGFANAQGMSRDHGASGGAAVQHSAPAEHGAASGTMDRDSGSAGMKAEQNEKMPSGKTAQDSSKAKGDRSKSMSSEMKDNAKSKDMKAEGSKTSGSMKAESKSSTDSKSQTTTGNAATSATAAPPAEKRTQIVSAIRSEKIQETTNVNFNISVGAVVPTSVHFHPLPSRIVEIYPEWRGYEVILVSGRYIIVSPRTHKIVYIIES